MIRALALSLLLAGCTPVWVQPGKTADDFRKDAYECERDAAVVRDGIQAYGMQRRCLAAKGWTEK